ncbi:M42 family metallopeptidase [Aminobacterium mobile]|uniref:M42 family metallopeptidase n=1 Tax=Aminobacterium mobile TaxID=81467 RepID=UPI0004B16F75|nr:M42 family peptidase [Aminobacterium mobile]
MLEKLTNINGVCGNEDNIRSFIIENLKESVESIDIDPLGSLITSQQGGMPYPRVMIVAHMDEVGFIVTTIHEDGTIGFSPSGGVYEHVIDSKNVVIGTNHIPGIIRMGESFEKSYIDIGSTSRDETLQIVDVGDFIAFKTCFGPLGGASIKAKALDDRTGCFVLMNIMASKKWDFPIYGVFSSQEEVGERGALSASYRVQPHIGIVLEGTVCSDLPTVEPYRHSTTLGGGPAISIADSTSCFDVELSEILCKLAEEKGIPWQRRRIMGGGNDGGVVHLSGSGARTVTISVPCRYIHSSVSVANLEDVQNTIHLVETFLSWLNKGDLSK